MKRRNSSDGYRREKIIVTACSVLVLTALTVTGVSIYRNSQTEEQEENIVDFSVLEDGNTAGSGLTQAQTSDVQNYTSDSDVGELDYDPYYAAQDALENALGTQEDGVGQMAGAKGGESEDSESESGSGESESAGQSGSVGYSEISGGSVVNQTGNADAATVNGNGIAGESGQAQTEDGSLQSADGTGTVEGAGLNAEVSETDGAAQSADTQTDGEALEAVANAVQEELNLHFDEATNLTWPIVGNVVLNYSMDKTIYFQTLQQYKYNPSIVISAVQGTNVACAADGVVKSIYEDPQTGLTLVMNLGDGYELTYGQLTDISVEEGDFVETGVILGKVAAPTKYYTKEGTNVYFKLTKDQEPVNPLDYLG